MLDPKHLYWLSEIADAGALNRAALKLNVTQPTLTRAVKVVEDHVDAPVFVRSSNGMRPTKIGERLVEIGRSIAQHRSDAEDAINLWKEGLDRELRIGVGPMLAISIMGDFFAELIERKPNYAVRVVSATASRLLERLNSGELDLVLAPEQINLYRQDLIQEELMKDELAVFVRKAHPLLRVSDPICVASLQDQNWISVGALSGIYGSNKDVFDRLGVTGVSAEVSFTGDINMAMEILQQRDCLCILPKRLATFSRYSRHLEELKVEDEFPTRNITIWHRQEHRDHPDFSQFKKRLFDFFQNFGRI